MARIREKSVQDIARDEVAGDFRTVYDMIERKREKAARILGDIDANVWTRKKALGTVLECERAAKAIVRIMGNLEDAIEGGYQVKTHGYGLDGGDDE